MKKIMILSWSIFSSALLSKEAYPRGYDVLYTMAPQAYLNAELTLPKPATGPPDLSTSHQRSNEIRSLLGGYLLDQLSKIQEVEDEAENSNPQGRYNQYLSIKPMITYYCTVEENQVFYKTDLSDEGASKLKRCAERALGFETPILRKIKTGMYRSDQEQASLQCTMRDPKGLCMRQPLDDRNFHFFQKNPSHTLPYLPTFEDLQNYARKKMQEGALPPFTEKEYQTWIHNNLEENDQANWYQHNVTLEPLREDFIRTITADKDPQQPQLGKTHIFELLPNGSPRIDEESYRKAHDAWVANKSFLKEIIMHGAQNSWAIQNDFVKSDDKTYAQAQHYAQSRGPLVDEINKILTGGSQGSSNKLQKGSNSNETPRTYTGKEKILPPTIVPKTNTQESVTYDPEIFSVDSFLNQESN